MSRFLSEKYAALTPYTPGEQPSDMRYIKLNTNESPFPPSEKACACAADAAKQLRLYPDPNCTALTARLAEALGVSPDEVLVTNGSDEILNFAFMAFCDAAHPAAFPDITYGFYKVFAQVNGVPYEEIPLREDFTVCPDDYCRIEKTVFLANPNAPTGIALPRSAVERIVKENPDHIVVVDEAYVDFGAESCVGLIKKYDNLLVTQTFSKSRSMAGARLGFGVGNPALIRDLNTIKYSTNPYNINRMTMAAAEGMLADEAATRRNCAEIEETRAYFCERLREIGFTFPESRTNFVFAKHPAVGGDALYRALKKKGILVRHFDLPRIADYNRITIGTREQMDALFEALREIIGAEGGKRV